MGRLVDDIGSRPAVRAALVALAALAAYRYSLQTLLGTLGTDTPLAYLGLAPFIACGIAVLSGRPRPGAPDVNDRNIDYLVGLPLLATAVVMTVVLPARMSILYWYYRVDLLSLPLFVAGAVAILFGTSTLYRVRYAVGFLLLSWPAPYNWALAHGMGRFSQLTLGCLHWLVARVHVATAQPGGDGSVFTVHHGAATFTLSVASACTGVDSFVGFLLVGLAVMTVVDGPRRGRVLWIATGMALSFALNLIRLMVIFWAGGALGEKVALDGLHPVLGLILFCAGVAAMVTGMGWFGLDVRPSPAAIVAPDARPPAPWRVAPSLRAGALALVAVVVVIAVADGGFSRYSPVADNLGSPRLVSFTQAPIDPAGWTVSPIARYPWAAEYFGSGAEWTRYEYAPLEGGAGPAVFADVVNTSDLESFSTYDVIACYDYHGYGLSGIERVSLGDGIDATELTFTIASLGGAYDAVYWVWPVQAGSGVRYERIVLLVPATAGRSFLGHFARTLVSDRASTAAVAGASS